MVDVEHGGDNNGGADRAPTRVAVYHVEGHRRSTLIAEALCAGIRRAGDVAVPIEARQYRLGDSRRFDLASFYGLEANLKRAYEEFAARKRIVFVDLGYFGRHDGGRWSGYHKLVRNARHPTAYFRARSKSADRFESFKIPIAPWRRRGTHILLAGMSEKAAQAEGFKAEQWEREAVVEVRRHTDRPIVYRSKPNWPGARPILGTEFSPKNRSLEEDLANCWAVVTHHSNVAIDAALAGIPVFCIGGVASTLGTADLSRVEEPSLPADRWQWACDLSYCQWSVAEIERGTAWKYLKREGLT